MAKAEIGQGIVGPSKEEIKSLTGKGAKEGLVPWIPKEWKRGIATALGLATAGRPGAGIGVAAFSWYLEHRPAIVEPVSAAQIPPAPEVGVSSEAKTAPDYIERVSVEEKIPIEEVSVEQTAELLQDLQNKVDEIYDLRRKRAGLGEPYTVQEGDTLWDIAARESFGREDD